MSGNGVILGSASDSLTRLEPVTWAERSQTIPFMSTCSLAGASAECPPPTKCSTPPFEGREAL